MSVGLCEDSASGVLIRNFGGFLTDKILSPPMPSWGTGGQIYVYFNLPLRLSEYRLEGFATLILYKGSADCFV
jgi:hypothetical protein